MVFLLCVLLIEDAVTFALQADTPETVGTTGCEGTVSKIGVARKCAVTKQDVHTPATC